MFVYVFSDEIKDYLISRGHLCLRQDKTGGKTYYLFANDVVKILKNNEQFSESDYVFTNRLKF